MIKHSRIALFMSTGAIVLSGMSIFRIPFAHASTALELVGTMDSPAATGTPTPSGTPGYGAGLRLVFSPTRRLSLELGGLYLSRNYTFVTSNTMTMMDGTVGFRLRLGRVLYLAGGGYGNYYLTNPQPMVGVDYGMFGGAGILIPCDPLFALNVRVDYHYALHALTVGANSITPSEFVGTAGFTFGLNFLRR